MAAKENLLALEGECGGAGLACRAFNAESFETKKSSKTCEMFLYLKTTSKNLDTSPSALRQMQVPVPHATMGTI